MSAEKPLVILGGGLAGCLAALALAERRPEVPFLLLEAAEAFGGNHLWSFFDSDVAAAERAFLRPLVSHRWSDYEVRFPNRRRTLGTWYNSLRSDELDRHIRAVLTRSRFRLGARVAAVAEDHVSLEDGERIEARAVIDARGPQPAPGLHLAWQKFVGRTYRFDSPHGCARPVVMDACVDQDDGYRFVYALPFSDTELMVEDTYYSASPVLDVPLVGGRVATYLRCNGLDPAEAVAEESGVLPILLDGELESLWPDGGPAVARLGLRGGFFHPTTGYSLPDAARNALVLAARSDFSPRALHDLFRARALLLWRERRFYQTLNRMLFRAAGPAQRYRVLQHFYRLPQPIVERFYAGDSSLLDKLRILSGRPPVPVRRAVAAMRERRT